MCGPRLSGEQEAERKMLQPYPDRRGGDAREPSAGLGPPTGPRGEMLRAKIQAQRARLAGLPGDTHEAEYCRRQIRYFEAQLRALEQAAG